MPSGAVDVVEGALERVQRACGTKKHADIVDAIDAVRATTRDGTFEWLGTTGAATTTSGRGDALREAQMDVVLPPLRAAMESGSASVIAAALGAVQVLISRGLVEGRATLAGGTPERFESTSDASGRVEAAADVDARDDGDVASDAIAASREEDESEPSGARNHAGEIVDAICGAAEVRDEAVELQVLKSILTAVSSRAFEVHDRALLRVVRTCYNIYLSSKSEVNQNTAKATLTQMLTTVFHRLEADDPHASAPTIVVADLLRPIGSDAEVDGVTAMSAAVQSFVNKVTTDMNSVGSFNYFSDPDAVVKSDAIEHAITEGEFDNDTAPMTPNAMTQSLDAFSPGAMTPARATGTTEQASELETDAFLVFRSLCKLSKKPRLRSQRCCARSKQSVVAAVAQNYHRKRRGCVFFELAFRRRHA